MVDEDSKHPPLGDTGSSRTLRIGVSVAGAIPFAGATIQTVLTEAIPNIRTDRMEAYIRHLQDQIDDLSLELALQDQTGLDVFEEGLWQSARALSEKRKKYIANLVTRGLQTRDFEQQETRHFMRILEQLDDRQIVLLAKYHPKNLPFVGNDAVLPFNRANKDVADPGHSVEDLLDFKQEEGGIRLNALMVGQLSSLGLLEESESIDSIGKPLRRREFHISESGKDFLNFIGVVPKEGSDGK